MEGQFTWTIKNFSRLTKKHTSDSFVVGDYKWRVLIFPKGSNVDHLSLYLEVADSSSLPNGWSRYAQVCLSVVNQVFPHCSVRKDALHKFNARESHWGFTSVMPFCDLYAPSKGFLKDDTIIVKAEVAVRKDSETETGYVGLKNQGTNSYMNSLLQSLYHIPYFRKAVYSIPTMETDVPSNSTPLALQSLFYELQYNVNSVATKELIGSLEWNTRDVQEFKKALYEKLEDKMKGTAVDGTIQQLFEGHHMTFIECINLNKNSTKESFYDIMLDTKGCRDIYESFDKYVDVEHLEGDDKYHTEEHGLQDARRRVLFINFPPVLQLQLNWSEDDYLLNATVVKISDHYDFPLELDLDKDGRKYLSPDADKSVRNLFTLHSVLVHSGAEHGGHSHAFVRPNLSDNWIKFDDERVTRVDLKRDLTGKTGALEDTSPNATRFSLAKPMNAYTLVYIRKCDMKKVLCDGDEQDIGEHLRVRLKKIQEKKAKKEEALRYTILKVARNEDLVKQIGRDIYFDLVDHGKEEFAKLFGIPVQFQRFWLWAKRVNRTYRPCHPLTPEEETQSVGQLKESNWYAHKAGINLFLEVQLGMDLHPIQPPERTNGDILIFCKVYDPSQVELRYVGSFLVKSRGKPSEILTKLNEMAGFSSSQEIELYEEIKFEPIMCEPIDKNLTFQDNQLEDGDIVCFQKTLPTGGVQEYCYPTVVSFMEYVHAAQILPSHSVEETKNDYFCYEISKHFNYEEVVKRVCDELSIQDRSKIRLTLHNSCPQKSIPVKYRGVHHLSEMKIHYSQTCDILAYEVLEDDACKAPSSCAICWDAPVEGACIPCGHMAGCMYCLNKTKVRILGCPICRAKIQQVVRIYAV